MDTATRPEPAAAPPPPAPSSVPARRPGAQTGLGAELRESLLLLGCAVGVTVGLTTVAQAALSALS